MKCICEQCEKGELHKVTRDVEISHKHLKKTVQDVSGLFCDVCEEIIFDKTTDSATRFAAASDVLVLAAREEVAKKLKSARTKLKLTKVRASLLSGGGHNAFSRYESGAAQPVAAVVNLFTLLEQHPELLQEAEQIGQQYA